MPGIPGEKVYVTHQEMNGILWRIIGAIGGVCVLLLTAGAAALWTLSSMFAAQGESLGVVRLDVAVIKAKVDALSSATVKPTNEIQQAQYVLVELPISATDIRNQNVRDVLTKQGFIDATP